VWGWALLSYSNGVDSLAAGLGGFLNSIPLVRSTALAAWAEDTLRETIEALGLQGVDLGTPKPVIVNTLHVARASETVVGDALVNIKQGYSALPGSGSGSLFGSVVDGLLDAAEQQGGALLESEFTVFTIRFGDAFGLPQIPVKISLPQSVVEHGKQQLSEMRASFPDELRFGGNYRVWE
ncbi:MAG: hypothetical protein LBP28_03725, partial [Coriobacteriales bacterium]|nr:hypothetical protein [Coriobacteriales bacterium]